MNHIFQNKKGVALMLVLSALILLTTMVVEFAYNTTVNYHIATNERDRLKAYYLAKSALNFMKLELKFDKTFRQIVQSQNLGQYLGGNANLPLCQQFPLSTGLIRLVFTGGGLPGEGSEEDEGGGRMEEGGGDEVEDMKKDVSISQEKNAEEFLEFEGDFDAQCVDESTKINLNGFAGLSQTASDTGTVTPFDQYKNFLIKFMSQPKYELLFKESDVRVQDVVQNIGDWIDSNSQGVKGFEGAAYEKAEVSYKIRNRKLITLLEMYLIDGVIDEWFAPMMDLFTVYGDSRVNVCTASEDVVSGVIRRYVESTPSLPPLRLEDPEEMGRLLTAIAEACASGASGAELKQAVGAAMDAAIGTVSGGTAVSPAAGASQGFGEYISTESRFYSLNLTGQVGDITVRITTVVDVKESDPKKWTLLYWRVY